MSQKHGAEETPTTKDWQELNEEKMGDQTGVIDGKLMAELRAHPELKQDSHSSKDSKEVDAAAQPPEWGAGALHDVRDELGWELGALLPAESSVMLGASVQAVSIADELMTDLPARVRAPEPTGIMNPTQRDALARMTGTDGDAELMTSAPRLPTPLRAPMHQVAAQLVEITPNGFPCGPGDAELGAGQMHTEQQAKVRSPAERTLHLNQSDILASEPDREQERTTVAPARPGARRKSLEPEATMVPGADFFERLEDDRRRAGIEGAPVGLLTRAPDTPNPFWSKQAPAPIKKEQEQAQASNVWTVVGVVLTALVLISIVILWQGRW